VIILAADGPDFSSGHDLAAWSFVPVAAMGGNRDMGLAEGRDAFQCGTYIGLSPRRRDLPKPTIAPAQKDRCASTSRQSRT
jgi:enoyl-CoA hydratase